MQVIIVAVDTSRETLELCESLRDRLCEENRIISKELLQNFIPETLKDVGINALRIKHFDWNFQKGNLKSGIGIEIINLDILNESALSDVDALLFCGHLEYNSIIKDAVSLQNMDDFISKFKPVICGLFGCDVGRVRDGYLYDFSHRHALGCGPIYCAFTRKVTKADLLNSSIVSGISCFIRTKLALLDVTDFRFLAKVCLTACISSSNDPGIFYNDSNIESTVHRLLPFSNTLDPQTVDPEQFNHLVQFHLYTCEGNSRPSIDEFLTCLTNNDNTTKSVFEQLYSRLKIPFLKEMYNEISNTKLSADSFRKYCKYEWMTMEVPQLCKALFSGMHGSFRIGEIAIFILTMMCKFWNDREAFSILGVTLLILDDQTYLMVDMEENFPVFKRDGLRIGFNRLAAYYQDDRLQSSDSSAIDLALQQELFKVRLQEMNPLEYFGSSITDLYQNIRKENHFCDLFSREQNIVILRNFKEDFWPSTFSLNRPKLLQTVQAMVTLIQFVNNISEGREEFFEKTDRYEIVGIEDAFEMKRFDVEATCGKNRIKTFPKYLNKNELFFVESRVHFSDNNADNRRRFVFCFRKYPDTANIKYFHLFYTNCHYGQDYYPVTRETMGSFVDKDDFIGKQMQAMRDLNVFPFSYVGRLQVDPIEWNLCEPPNLL